MSDDFKRSTPWLVSLCLVFVFRSPVAAQEWKEVFNPYQVITLHLQMESNDWDRVRHDQPIQNESWIPELAEAQMWADGETPITVQTYRCRKAIRKRSV
jgi:hypothetical protein